MPKASRAPLRDVLMDVISQLPMRSTTAAQLRAITGLDANRVSFSLHRWVDDGFLVSVGDYRRRYFRAQADAMAWMANPVDLPVDPALLEALTLQSRQALLDSTRSKVSRSDLGPLASKLPQRASRPMTAEERRQAAEQRAQQRNADQREQQGDRRKPRINYRHRAGNTTLAPAHAMPAMPAPVTVANGKSHDSTVIVPPTVRITRAPTRPGRFEATGPVIGGFATLPLGRYLDEAGFSKYLETNA